uniref:Amidase domain-containing protein n=1 Tax=Bionectria ochroleuca TaxID=29856 RepID=A0A8H7TVE2_BIOOC
MSVSSLSSLLDEKSRLWLATDDVFSNDFLKHVYIVSSAPGALAVEDTDELGTLFTKWGVATAHFLYGSNDSYPWMPGPYVNSGSVFHAVWRLFPDTNGAFMFPTVPSEHDPRLFVNPGTLGVPVPSRCYYPDPSPEKPLSGMRVAIKDNIDVAGVPTSVGSKAFAELYGARDKNALCVERLLDAGALIIGKAKTVQFASGEGARDWIDFQAPFNPRGDGYQDPECSSAGSATACSAYNWVDIALGTDTIGSIIGPAAHHGLFGLRPSLGSVPMSGIVPFSKELDTVGPFTRTASLATKVMQVLTAADMTALQRLENIQLLYPVDMFGSLPEYPTFTEPFILQLEEFLGVKRVNINIRERFKEEQLAGGKSTDEFLSQTTARIQLFDCYRSCAPFLDEYKKKFNKTAFADPYIRFKWKLGEKITQDQYEEAIAQRDVLREWVLQKIIPQNGPSEKQSILIMPNGKTEELYRYHYDGRTLEEEASLKQGYGFKDSFLAILAGLPFFNVPVGQISYISTVTERSEVIPLKIGLVGPKGE